MSPKMERIQASMLAELFRYAGYYSWTLFLCYLPEMIIFILALTIINSC